MAAGRRYEAEVRSKSLIKVSMEQTSRNASVNSMATWRFLMPLTMTEQTMGDWLVNLSLLDPEAKTRSVLVGQNGKLVLDTAMSAGGISAGTTCGYASAL